MIYYMPIEPLEERYTLQMMLWVAEELRRQDLHHVVVAPDVGYGQIEHGQFLDSWGSARYKCAQLQMTVDLLQKHKPTTAVFLVGDCWYPGIETLKLVCDLAGIASTFFGWHYAGMFDPTDYYAKTLGGWARSMERHLCSCVFNAVFVGSRFHADQVRGGIPESTPIVTGLVFDDRMPIQHADLLETPTVAWPHRIAEEKNPEELIEIASRMPDVAFCVSTNSRVASLGGYMVPENVRLVRHATKRDYYRFLTSCHVVLSTAFQETYGYAVHEAAALGVRCVAPDRACYNETAASLYTTTHQAEQMIRDAIGRRLSEGPLDYEPSEYLNVKHAVDVAVGWL